MSNLLTVDEINTLEEIVERDRNAWGINSAREVMQKLKAEHCTSENRHKCNGVLWECSFCESVFCCIEGSEHDGLCDACWAAEQRETTNEHK